MNTGTTTVNSRRAVPSQSRRMRRQNLPTDPALLMLRIKSGGQSDKHNGSKRHRGRQLDHLIVRWGARTACRLREGHVGSGPAADQRVAGAPRVSINSKILSVRQPPAANGTEWQMREVSGRVAHRFIG